MPDQEMKGQRGPKYVHVDMKGGPPTVSYFLKFLDLIKEWGANGVLVEWEDMFPWSGKASLKCVSKVFKTLEDPPLFLDMIHYQLPSQN